MAISFSRPDPSSPAAVGAAQFTVGRRGFEQEEVRDFLRMVSAELARLQERERFLESELRALQTRGMSGPGVLDEETVTTLLGAETARVLTVAREAAQQMRTRAAEAAERLVREAGGDAARIREEAEIESSRHRSDVAVDVEAELELAKQQGREMVIEAREYREKVLAEMARRREAARHQIEKLIHGRDRLLGVFERASSVANDVVDDLKEFDDISAEIAKVSGVNSTGGGTTPMPFDYEKEKDKHADDPPEFEEEIVVVVADEIAITDEIVIVERTEIQVTPIASASSAASMAEHPSTEPAKTEHIADVVQLFGKNRKQKGLDNASQVIEPPTLTPVVETPVVETPVVETPVVETPEIPSTSAPKKSVDDLFAKLRSTSISTVATETLASRKKIAVRKLEVVKDLSATKESVKAEKSPAPAATPALKADAKPKVLVSKVDGAVFVKRQEVIDPLIVLLSRKIKRLLADEENSILTYLESKKSIVALEKVLPASATHTQQYVEALAEDLMAAAMGGARSLSSSMKADLRKKITNAAVMSVLSKSIDETMVRPLRGRIQRCVEQSNGSREEMSNLVRSVYREWKMQRVEITIPDLARLAYSRGAYLVLDPDTPVCWMVDPNGPACADAEDNALAGATPLGTQFPTGDLHPTAHGGCRCLVTPSLG
jgi:cell division septum initiation protein DivIVA